MLRKKMIRDIRKNISQYITIFLMILIGIFAYTGIEAYMLGMEKSADNYYNKNNLEDFNVYGEFSTKDIEKVKKIYNINDANGKLTLPSLGYNKDNNHKYTINFIKENTVSKFYIVDGIEFDINNSGIWLDYYYAKENNIKVGDIIDVSYEKYDIKREVVGIITVPDMVYYTKDDKELFPDHSSFGFIYLSINEIPNDLIEDNLINTGIFTKEYFNKGIPVIYQDYISYNNIMVDVNKEKNIDSVKEKIKDKLDIDAIVDIKDSLSYKAYQSEIDQGKSFIGIFSGLFIFIAVLSVITSMSRTVKKERKEIGTLKALGFSDIKILKHYLSFGFYISIVAIILGIILGYFILGNAFITMEMKYYVIPTYKAIISYKTFVVSISVLLIILCTIYLSTRKILTKNAADTLRFEKPSVKKNSLNFTRSRIFKYMSFSTKWNIRDIIRNKIRTIMGIVGMIGCIILLIIAFGMNDTLNNYLDLEFSTINKYESKINLIQNIDIDTYNSLIEKYGNNTSLTLQIEIIDDDIILNNNIFINDSNGYVNTLDSNDKSINLEDDGVYITRRLAEKLNKEVGSNITWRIYGTDNYYRSKIIGLNKDPQNQNITMTKNYFESLDFKYIGDTIYSDKSNITLDNGIASIQSINDINDSINDMLATLQSMVYLIIVVACLLGIIIIYNMGILSFIEKNYQFSTLKVLGFSNFRIARIFIKQHLWIGIIAILVGLPIGSFLLNYIFDSALSIDYDFSAYISLYTYIMTGIIAFILTLIVSIILSTKIRKIDMVTSLKGNE